MIVTALNQLQDEIDALAGAKEGTSSWALLQAKSLGMSFLKTVDRLKLVEPVDIANLRKKTRLEVVRSVDEVADARVGVNTMNPADSEGAAVAGEASGISKAPAP